MLNITVAIAMLLTTVAYAQGITNLVSNPGFEELKKSGFVQDWRRGKFSIIGQDIIADQTVAHNGKCSLRLGINSGSFVTSSAASIIVKPNTRYFITWWCKTEGLNQSRAYVFLQTNKGQRTLVNADQYMTTDWTQHFAEYVTTAEETMISPMVTTHDIGGDPCFAWFDDIGIYEGSFPPTIQKLYEAYKFSEYGVSKTALLLSKTTDLIIWSDNLAARIYSDDGLPHYAQPAEAFSLSAACNEQNYFQVSIIPESDLTNVLLVPGELRGPDKIPATSINWWQVGYANVKTTQRPTTRLGPTPDPLLPAEPATALNGVNTTFLIGIKVPKDTKSGTYQGTVAIRAEGKTIGQVPIKLRVYGFTLPDDPVFRTIITFSPNEMARFDKRPWQEVEKDICRVLAEHGIRGLGAVKSVEAKLVDEKIICDFTEFDELISWVIEDLHYNSFFLGPLFGGGTSEGWDKHKKWLGIDPLSKDFNKYFPSYMGQIGKHLRERGWMDKAYVYLWDEPQFDYFDKVVALHKLALKGDAALKIWETTSPSNRAFWGIVKAWSVPFSRPYFDEIFVEQRRVAGDEIWVYNIPCSLEIAPQDHRLWFWQAVRYGVMGAQLWNVTFYHGIDPWVTITPEPYPVGRGAKSLYYYNAGEAIMLYPRTGGGVPYASIRLKLLQKGLDDFGYLTLYREALAGTKSAADAQAQMRKEASALVSDLQTYNRDSNLLEEIRNRIAEVIEAIALK